MNSATPVASIRSRMAWALAIWSIASGLAVALAVWLTVSLEVDELLDDSLQAAASMLVTYLPQDAVGASAASAPAVASARAPATSNDNDRFAWQLVSRDGAVLRRSPLAPQAAWYSVPRAGFSDAPNWRVYGLPTAHDGQTLYAAQSRAERQEMGAEAALTTALAALAIGWLAHTWISRRLRRELAPLQALSTRLAGPLAPAGPDGPLAPLRLGVASRQELQPVHDAIDGLTQRLHQRLLTERAFAGHAAHALRTPLAGIDAQLAVALREAGPAQQPRIARVREAATRLQGVVASLLALFRSAGAVQRRRVDVAALLARLPAAGLRVALPPQGGVVINADEDLLAAALLNLLDNAVRHGATAVRVSMPAADALRLDDDGPGVDPARRAALLAALAAEPGEVGEVGAAPVVAAPIGLGLGLGLGLALAARVAQAHGGQLALPEVAQGFAVELWLGEMGAPAAELQATAAD